MKNIVATAPTAVVAVVLLLGAWLLFAPAELGGATRYVVADGVSMEPGLSRGDLVLVRAGGEPSRGDVVLYRDPELDVQVLHRVTDLEDGRLVLKGDANDFLDDARLLPVGRHRLVLVLGSVRRHRAAVVRAAAPRGAPRVRPHAPRPRGWRSCAYGAEQRGE